LLVALDDYLTRASPKIKKDKAGPKLIFIQSGSIQRPTKASFTAAKRKYT